MKVLDSRSKLHPNKQWSQKAKRSHLTPEPTLNLCPFYIIGKCYPIVLDFPSSSIIEPQNFSWDLDVSDYVFLVSLMNM